MAENPYNLRSGSGAPSLAPANSGDTVHDEPRVLDSQSVHNTPVHSNNTVAINTQIQLAKIQLASEKERTKQAELKACRLSTPDPLLPALKCLRYKKRVKEEDLYYIKDYCQGADW